MRTIVAVTSDDWMEFREIRLRALADSPDAFSMTLDAALDQPEEAWRARLDTEAPILVVRASERTVSMGGGWLPSDDSARMMVWGMWTAPESRGHGHGLAVIQRLLDWTRAHQIGDVSLHVTEGNDGARHLYERCGFRATGEWEPLREGSGLRIELMRWAPD